MAPEMIKKRADRDGEDFNDIEPVRDLDTKVDMWSIGVVLFVLVMGEFPLDIGDVRGKEVREKIN